MHYRCGIDLYQGVVDSPRAQPLHSRTVHRSEQCHCPLNHNRQRRLYESSLILFPFLLCNKRTYFFYWSTLDPEEDRVVIQRRKIHKTTIGNGLSNDLGSLL